MITARSADAPAVSLRPVDQEITVPIASNIDIVNARQWGRTLAFQGGCSPTEAALIAMAISELARNIVLYAKRGEIVVSNAATGQRVRNFEYRVGGHPYPNPASLAAAHETAMRAAARPGLAS